MTTTLSAAALAELLGTDEEPLLLDVREPAEFESWSIPGARNLPLGELTRRLREIPSDRLIATICASGNRSKVAAKTLEQAGFSVANVEGGMTAWARVYDMASFDTPRATIVQIRRRGKGCLSYLVGAGDEAFVIDPSVDLGGYLGAASARGWSITRVFETHLHADHLSGARALAEASGAHLHLNPSDAFEFPFEPVVDGDRFRLPGGAEISVAVFHTPGHTEGSTGYLIDGAALLSGDTLFVDGVGRPDLAERAEEFAHNLYRSLHNTVLSLPDAVVVLPAHYGDRIAVTPGRVVGASLGSLRETLGALALDEASFVAWATKDLQERPANYQTIIQANRGRTELTANEASLLEAGPNRCSV